MTSKHDIWEEVEALLTALTNSNDLRKLYNPEKNSIEYDDAKKSLDESSKNFEKLASILYEIGYYNNHGRSLKQRLESKFSSIYLLTKKKNGSIRNALINIRGYRAIKSNGLFDIGYYLKNNPDVRLSGDDPIMHYIYYGYNEGRNPSADFDSEYYLDRYDDLNGLNPLVHYSLYGMKEGRSTTSKEI